MIKPPPSLSANEKRRISCQRVGSEKKRTGHKREEVFNEMFGKPADGITYKAEADCTFVDENARGVSLRDSLTSFFGDFPNSNISLKSGNNLQFILGRIDEVSTLPVDKKLSVFKEAAFWKKYLGKDSSGKPAGWLVYRDDDDKTWAFFLMSDVINYIVESAVWRLLDSGRIKGDFPGKGQILTYELREGKGYFLGANGNKGRAFINALKDKIKFLIVHDEEGI